jgi:transglutaminase-like putative cysteine protease
MSVREQRRPASDTMLAAATGTVAGGMFLTTLPLSSIFTDWSWLTVSIGCALPYLVIVAALRYRGAARWWHSAIGLLASVLMLFWVFVPQHLGYGVLPTTASGHDISDLVNQARQSMQAEHAPLASTQALRLLVAAALTGLACLTDVLGVLLRRPLLAAAPLLEVLAVASATSSKAANPFWFAAAAIGFLLILLAGTRLQDRAWGPSVDGSAGRLGGGRRMAVTGIVAALIVPLLLPAVPTNLLARAAHHNGTGDGTGNGKGQIVLSSLASLRGSLQLPTPKLLFSVQVSAGQAPQYIRTYVDDEFDNKSGWTQSGSTFGDPNKISLNDSPLPLIPSTPNSTSGVSNFQANFTIANLGGSALPILANPLALSVNGSGSWNSRTSSVSGVSLRSGTTYTENVVQPNPSDAELHQADHFTTSGDPDLDKQYTQLPKQQGVVTDLANRLTAGLTSDYDKARAISAYFNDNKNGFTYSVSTSNTDTGDALVDFLNSKTGFCQQYAAAAAVLMRLAGLPARVVIGFTHQTPDADGKFVVTTSDAHAWVEVFFNSIGWISFDPTPISTSAGRAAAFRWDPHPSTVASSTAEPTANKGPSSLAPSLSVSLSGGRAGASGSTIPAIVWQVGLLVLAVVIVLIAVFFGPRLLRRRQRRRRLDRARETGNPEPLWLELAATAADRDALWPSTVTVGQVAQWLSRHGVDERGRAAVSAVASTVERDRYSSQLVTKVPPESIAALDQALTRWARRTDRRLSLINRWLPKSLFGRQPRWHR